MMKFAKMMFLVAGIYGLVVVAPLSLTEGVLNATQPPAITHPEYYSFWLPNARTAPAKVQQATVARS